MDIIGNYQTSIFRKFTNKILKEKVVSIKNVKNILNVGALQQDRDKEGDLYINYFKDANYYTIDKNRNINHKFHFNIDLHDLSTINIKFDLILNMNVLEHTENPFVCANNCKNILNTKGYIFVAVPYFYPIHKNIAGGYSDYWRFSDDGLRILFKDMKEIFIMNAPCVVLKVEDRGQHYENPDNCTSGYCCLFQQI